MFLLDTNVVSELRRKQCNLKVRRWVLENEQYKFFISVVTIYEIRRGICSQDKLNSIFANELSEWLTKLRHNFYGRILPITDDIADEWGKISFIAHNTSVDNIIAATAKVHNLIVVTRNIKHFNLAEVSCINPWEYT